MGGMARKEYRARHPGVQGRAGTLDRFEPKWDFRRSPRNERSPRGRGGARCGFALVRIFILDEHVIYRRGLAASLAAMDDVDCVGEARTPEEAWASRELPEADVVVVDPDLEGGFEFIRDTRERTGAQVVV